MKWLSILYEIVGFSILITVVLFPDLVTITDDNSLNLMLGLLLSLHFFNSAKIENIVAEAKEEI